MVGGQPFRVGPPMRASLASPVQTGCAPNLRPQSAPCGLTSTMTSPTVERLLWPRKWLVSEGEKRRHGDPG